MTDGQHLFPHGRHPDIRHQRLKPNSTYHNATHYTRTQRPVKYYFTDFDLSRHPRQGFESMSVQKKIGFEFMEPLVADMVQPDPTKRPKIDEVVARFEEVRKNLGPRKLRSRGPVQEREWPYLPHRIVRHWYHHIVAIVIRRSAVPVPSI
ncbi:hypothetical protein C8R43DRAFT_954181 [Mycena crocata]|nr:hypothetical protein C8R43DRAFT_954181 [Mycena crocata]